LPLIVSYLLGRVDAFARDGRAKKTIAFSGTPHRHSRHRYHAVCIICFHYISCCPAHLTRFPQECFQSKTALLFVMTNIIFASICVCVLYYLYMYKNYTIAIILDVINVIIWQPSRDRQKKQDEVFLHILSYNIIIACVGLHYACTLHTHSAIQ